ncbi:hypothetical protein M7I_3270 [Glarea lozoyensis 74030]|uniref:Uncharacterized protein n=1 Tax=Glarea lozoyensis (strain ATCC 74030 / MF5533) TaxID=1104152 RepID=H0EL34_GLAL7|nr:hypothetical protein M7I_3270 [Glarea lozoyensis 74030]
MAQYLKAQRILFALEDKFEPSLLLDERSYHTTIAIFAASEKSQRESKAASLQVRGWPPWRKAQDGIDERRTPEQDKSRVLLALAQKNTSGYRDRHVIDEVLRIHGGEELDLTPTIHTRRWVTDRYNRSLKALENPSTNPKVWAARITATRDVQEAWSAFEEYRQNLGDPSLAMFFAMFQKLVYENLRRARNDPGPIIPGDGLEVLPVPENNFSESYKAHLQPPSLLELYDEMLACGILPAGRCLSFLVKHAPSITRGLSYLRDSKLFQPAQLSWLEGVPDRKDIVLPDNRSIVLSIPEHIFAAVVSLKCRFALRVLRDKPEAMNTGLSTATLPSDHPLIPKDQSSEAKFHGTFRSLPHVASLMKAQRSCYRPTWYALFKAIARPGTVMAKPFAGTQKDDRLSWRVLEAALNDFHSLGLELDPQGFNIICYGLCKAIPALKSERGEFYDAARVTETLKLEFKEMEEMKHGHDIRSVFVGIVHFLGSLGEAEPLLQKGAGIWGGWPQAKEIEHYRDTTRLVVTVSIKSVEWACVLLLGCYIPRRYKD